MSDKGADEVDAILEQWRAERPDVDARPMAVFGRLGRTRQLAESQMSATLDRFGLTLPSFDVLANLRRSGQPYRKTPSELAASSMLTSGGITFRLDRLEADGLIRRVPSDGDRRVMFAELTNTGFEVIDEVLGAHLATERKMLAKLTAKEQKQLGDLLRKLELSIQQSADEGPGSAS